MRIVRYEDVPATCDQILENVEMMGVTYEVRKDGRAVLRIEPVDEATKALFAAEVWAEL
jgi:hypothetical protein